MESPSFRKVDDGTIITPPKSVGDITSDAKGSGARYNAGKAPMDLVPLWVLFRFHESSDMRESSCLYRLAGWQQTGDLEQLHMALQCFDPSIFTDCANVFDYGRKKYAEWNWAKGMAWSVPLACAVRHLLAILGGEENDPESGLPHRGHVACNLCMLITFHTTYLEGDDRPRSLK